MVLGAVSRRRGWASASWVLRALSLGFFGEIGIAMPSLGLIAFSPLARLLAIVFAPAAACARYLAPN